MIKRTNLQVLKKVKGKVILSSCLIHANEGLAVIRNHHWIEAVNKGIEAHKAQVGNQKICDMDTVERSGFKGKDNSFERAAVNQSADT